MFDSIMAQAPDQFSSLPDGNPSNKRQLRYLQLIRALLSAGFGPKLVWIPSSPRARRLRGVSGTARSTAVKVPR